MADRIASRSWKHCENFWLLIVAVFVLKVHFSIAATNFTGFVAGQCDRTQKGGRCCGTGRAAVSAEQSQKAAHTGLR